MSPAQMAIVGPIPSTKVETMTRIPAQSAPAATALQLVSNLQQRFVAGLEQLAEGQGDSHRFTAVEWLRDEGRHGGGIRFEIADTPVFGRGSVNVSQVHYDDEPARRLGSATAISTIIHPRHPLAPSVHIHISWTEMKDGAGYWRIMADLNPAIENPLATRQFMDALKHAAPAQFAEATAQGDRYFYIPALKRHRGAGHFYLESYRTNDAAADLALASRTGATAIDTYIQILADSLRSAPMPDEEQCRMQLAYHTLYFFQVLTLDRGTTSGLLVHDQNDIGILGSLPAYIDRELLQSWRAQLPHPQEYLLDALLDALPEISPCPVDEASKARLAQAVRQHYTAHPQALKLQASADAIPPTVQNHQRR